MATHKLVPYALRLRKKRETEDFWELDSLLARNQDFDSNSFVDFFYDFCESYHSERPYTDEERQKTFGISLLENSGSTIEGVISTGEYGYSAELYDVEEQEYDEEGRLPTHSEELPFYFLFHYPGDGATRAYIILKEFQNLGAKTTLYNRLNDKLRNVSDEIMFRMPPVIETNQIEQLTEVDRIAKLKFFQKEVPRATHEQLSSDLTDESDVRETIEITATRDRSLFSLETLQRMASNNEYPFAELHGQEYDDIRVTIEQEESDRTLSLFEDEIKMQEVLSPPNHVLEEGHPSPSWLASGAQRFLNELLTKEGYPEVNSTPLQA